MVVTLGQQYNIGEKLLEVACTVVLFAWHVAAFEMYLCGCANPKRSKTTYVLYYATVVSRCTS